MKLEFSYLLKLKVSSKNKEMLHLGLKMPFAGVFRPEFEKKNLMRYLKSAPSSFSRCTFFCKVENPWDQKFLIWAILG